MEPIISVQNLQKSFGSLKAVKNLTFEVKRKEIFGLLGPNGAGKTTTITMLCGLQSPTEGNITFAGSDRRQKKSLIGYCPQENIFYPKLTCLEQLIFIGQLYNISAGELKTRATGLLSQLGLSDKTHVLAATLSGGMKRRLNIALALIHNPEILILDEPEAGLDPQSRLLVRDFIRQFGKEKTVILTTHNMDEADRLADRILIMDHGQLLMLDTPSNLKKSVGDGDLLELVPENAMLPFPENLPGLLNERGFKATLSGGSVIVRHPSILDQAGAIKEIMNNSGFPIGELKLRENTLEDVFIHLTGRNLRS